jgi:hypothetical protein
MPSVFAHQGGWDEILFVVVPIAIFAGLLVVANRRASRIEEQRRARGDGPPTGPHSGQQAPGNQGPSGNPGTPR